MLRIEDAHLPGLADLSHDRLCAITGADEVALLRLRYQAGKRAILHISARSGADCHEGTLWFFKGDKGRRLARRNKGTARFDPPTQALFEAFPHDHRMPQIRDFLANHQAILPGLTGARASAAPVLLRYRPGLSCTFRCELEGRDQVFVKLVNDDDPVRLRGANRAARDALAGSGVSVAPALGIDPRVGAIAYGRAPGVPLDAALARARDLVPLERAIAALRVFRDAPIAAERRMGPDMLLTRARESVAFVAVTAPSCLHAAAGILDTLGATMPEGQLRPIHGDMKLEHVFLDGEGVTLIDTESVSTGLPDYDLAQLYGRLWQAELEGHLPRPLVREASARVRAQAGPAFDWCLGVVAARLAKFYAQRPAPDMARSITAILDRLR